MLRESGKHALIVLHELDKSEDATTQIELLYHNIEGNFQQQISKPFNECFQLVNVHWHSVVQAAEKAIFTTSFPGYPVGQRYCFWDALTPDHALRSFMTFFLGDVIAYTADNNNNLREEVWKQMQPVCQSAPYSIIAHSLGSVIAFDYLYKLFSTHLFLPEKKEVEHRTALDPILQPYKQNFHHLFTMGSPLALFTLRQGSLWNKGINPFSGLRNPIVRAEGHHPLPKGLKRVWMNFYDKKDYLAYPLRELFSINPLYRQEPDAIPIDVVVQCGEIAMDAHTGYWSDSTIASSIADILVQTVSVLEDTASKDNQASR